MRDRTEEELSSPGDQTVRGFAGRSSCWTLATLKHVRRVPHCERPRALVPKLGRKKRMESSVHGQLVLDKLSTALSPELPTAEGASQ